MSGDPLLFVGVTDFSSAPFIGTERHQCAWHSLTASRNQQVNLFLFSQKCMNKNEILGDKYWWLHLKMRSRA